MNLRIEQFRQQLKTLISQADLPIGVLFLILQEYNQNISELYYQQIQKEMQQYQEGKINDGDDVINNHNDT